MNSSDQLGQQDSESLEKEIKSFVGELNQKFAREISENPSAFRSRAIGKFQAFLPRKSPGKQGSPEVKRAAELYQRLYVSEGKQANWHEIAKQVMPGYADMPLETQKYRRMQLRANVHGFRYDLKSRQMRNRKPS